MLACRRPTEPPPLPRPSSPKKLSWQAFQPKHLKHAKETGQLLCLFLYRSQTETQALPTALTSEEHTQQLQDYLRLYANVDLYPELESAFTPYGAPALLFLSADLLLFARYSGRPRSQDFPGFLAQIEKLRKRPAYFQKRLRLLARRRGKQQPPQVPQESPRAEHLSLRLQELSRKLDPFFGGFLDESPKAFSPWPYLLLSRHLPRHKTIQKLQRALQQVDISPLRDLLGRGYFREARQRDWSEVDLAKTLEGNAYLLMGYTLLGALSQRLEKREQMESILALFQTLHRPNGGYWFGLAPSPQYYHWYEGELRKILSPEEFRVLHTYFGWDTKTQPWEFGLYRSFSETAKKLGLDEDKVRHFWRQALEKLRQARKKRPQPPFLEYETPLSLAKTAYSLLWSAQILASREVGKRGEECLNYLWKKYVDPKGVRRSHSRYLLEDQLWTVLASWKAGETLGSSQWTERGFQLLEKVLENFSSPYGGFFYGRGPKELRPALLRIDLRINGMLAYLLQLAAQVQPKGKWAKEGEKLLSILMATDKNFRPIQMWFYLALAQKYRPTPLLCVRKAYTFSQLLQWRRKAPLLSVFPLSPTPSAPVAEVVLGRSRQSFPSLSSLNLSLRKKGGFR